MEEVIKEPHAILSAHNFRYELKDDGEFICKYIANVARFVEIKDECFDSKGNFVGKIVIDKKLEYYKNVDIEEDSKKGIVQINYNFYLLPLAHAWTAPEVEQLLSILDNSKLDAEFDLSFDRNIFNANTKQEICVWGNKRLIYNDNPKKISKVQYKENYNEAIKKYPDYKEQIKQLFNSNLNYL